MDYITAIILGIVEGITEFLPISSTGHLILAGDLLGFKGGKAETFEIVIQLGAILAVAVLYRKRIADLLFGWKKPTEAGKRTVQRMNLLHIVLGMLPALILGAILHDVIKTYLFTTNTVLWGLLVGGVFMIYAEKRKSVVKSETIDQLSYKQVFLIGLAQCLSLWPGFSRAGATIAGGLLVDANYKTSANFSFLVAIPMMVAASGYDLLKSYKLLSTGDIGFFAVGFIVAFLVAMAAVATFMRILEKVKLTHFAYYRFVVAAIFFIFIMS
ncbi:undecaprenyl-diphosphate phosphatase [Paenibacillus chondroitinus]|uniref:Undecaprenyl-diphosphatase n=1 Tax=Paenibacillus chondroitinus TaxID=59842 RepID=A0ABU6DNG2_9BACL|nr:MULTISPECIES: undecaprenyl-diphosphate phosphatase [Paenibacillus]MCY9660573.1 undecaprenyl-diphosphate phosphatase [Paenibacillus anseongense]MEB4799333.1 undecaprenyl-diphosphate phosphatase [Paenibacillus chondroitinus]